MGSGRALLIFSRPLPTHLIMTITLPVVQFFLIKRAKARMEFVGMDIVTVDTANEDLENAIATALRALGVAPSHPLTDGDFTTVDASQFDELLDRAEVRLLEDIQGNLAVVDITVGDRSERLSQIGQQIEVALGYLNKKIGASYQGLSAGHFDLDFQSKHPPEIEW